MLPVEPVDNQLVDCGPGVFQLFRQQDPPPIRHPLNARPKRDHDVTAWPPRPVSLDLHHRLGDRDIILPDRLGLGRSEQRIKLPRFGLEPGRNYSGEASIGASGCSDDEVVG